ncbi:hypothetical protein [Bacillus gaemokensis]|uniref:DUF11 domain-containing protein n=1 Tax=Bacillus gaemokensis TaxID=574375 RepID=A0A073KUB3_9BACI|nr:hypothetical protein [Bacillus gaemokensis]KEK25933.1 hypothetical protein BAGA_01460 [Bacillus gaemokensis]KYG38745.1 hypothetical protein AZF08_01540 [Bacillus gaemokensis]
MKIWKRISDQEMFPLFLQPVVWMEGGFKEGTKKQSIPNVGGTLQIRSVQEKDFSCELVYDRNDILFIQLEVENKGSEEISRVIVSHMILDHFAYIPNTLQTNKGTGEFLFQLVRWRIDKLLPNEKVQLIFQVKIARVPVPASILLRATYTFQYKGLVYGPLQTKEAILIQH